jgi:hypothetical protein
MPLPKHTAALVQAPVSTPATALHHALLLLCAALLLLRAAAAAAAAAAAVAVADLILCLAQLAVQYLQPGCCWVVAL